MSNRLDQERESLLQPKRIQYATDRISKLGYEIKYQDNTKIKFDYQGEEVTLFPYSGWHSGKSIKDGRGIENLLKQLNR